MKFKIILAIISLACGIGLYAFSDYITEQVAIGRGEIYRGQKTVDTINKTIDTTTQTQGLFSKPLTSGVQQKIDAGRRKADYYENLAKNLRMGGIALMILSGLLFLWGIFSRKKS